MLISIIFFVFSIFIVCIPCCLADDIRDVRPPVPLPPNYFLWFLLLAPFLAGALYFLIRFLLKKINKKQPSHVFIPPKPRETAYLQLRQLKRENLPAERKIKEYFTRLSGIVRSYIEGRFSINAPDMTTEEFLSSRGVSNVFNDQQKESLKQFLHCCDMVKFARYGSSDREIEESFLLAKRLVDETKEEETDRPT